MPSLNKITLIGHLGRDPEGGLGQGSGVAYCKFSVATSERRKVDGELKEITEWFAVTAFGKTAEFVKQYLQKGDCVYVEGRLTLEKWKDKETGDERSKLAVTADKVLSLSNKKDKVASAPQGVQTPAQGELIGGDDIPF